VMNCSSGRESSGGGRVRDGGEKRATLGNHTHEIHCCPPLISEINGRMRNEEKESCEMNVHSLLCDRLR